MRAVRRWIVRAPRTDREWAAAIVVGTVIVDLGWLVIASPEVKGVFPEYRIGFALFFTVPLVAGAVIGSMAAWMLLAGARWGRRVATFWALVGAVGAAAMFALPFLWPTSFITDFGLRTARSTLPWVSGIATIGSVCVLYLLHRDRPTADDRRQASRR